MAELIGRAQTDPGLADTLRTGWLLPRREATAAVLQQAVDRSLIRPDVDIQTVMDQLYAAGVLATDDAPPTVGRRPGVRTGAKCAGRHTFPLTGHAAPSGAALISVSPLISVSTLISVSPSHRGRSRGCALSKLLVRSPRRRGAVHPESNLERGQSPLIDSAARANLDSRNPAHDLPQNPVVRHDPPQGLPGRVRLPAVVHDQAN